MVNRKGMVLFILIFMLSIGIVFSFFPQREAVLESSAHVSKNVYLDLQRKSDLLLEDPFENVVHPSFASQRTFQENSAQDKSFAQKIEQILDHPSLEGALVGISIRSGETGELLHSHHGEIRLRPASNLKMLTAIAALEVLGEDYRFTTEIWTDGKIKNGTLTGNLYLRGKGDPTLLKEDFDQFAQSLYEKGIRKILGNIIADDFWYDDVRYSPDLNWSNEYNYTGAAVSALTLSPNEDYDAGTIVVRIYPHEEIGKPPKVVTIPETDYVTIDNRAKTVRKPDAKGLIVDREHGTNRLIIEGTLSATTPIEVWRSVWEPTNFALNVFYESLKDKQIQLSENVELLRGETPDNSELLFSKQSIPLKELLIPFMKLSNNGHGDILVKEMGKVVYDEGSWEKGIQVMKEQLVNFGISEKSISLRDGSGISFKNLIPPNELTKLLFTVQQEDWFPTFLTSQPVAGDPNRFVGGTLANRLLFDSTKGKVYAKTGSLTGVSTLSGYLTTVHGEEIIFSIMMNNYVEGWMPGIQDQIVQEIAEHSFQ